MVVVQRDGYLEEKILSVLINRQENERAECGR